MTYTDLVGYGMGNKPATGDLNTLFVYGIFLGKSQRIAYGMTSPRYATVEGYATVGLGFGNTIVEAVEAEEYTLTGLSVQVDPSFWNQIDQVEAGYDRIKITTTDGEEAWMYVERKRDV